MLQTLWQTLSRKKSLIDPHMTTDLQRSLTAFDLTLMGIGAIIGAGVFIVTGIAAATKAGPGVVVSYMIAGMASLFSALAYAELAACIGGTGSAYNYAYIGFGELIAWIIGWNLILEYLMSVATVAIGWSSYVNNFIEATFQIDIPDILTQDSSSGGFINIPAMLIIMALTVLLSMGIKHSARFNATIVFIKLVAIATFIGVAITDVRIENWHPFLPFGWTGVIDGAALVFFAYIGFDAISTAVDEAIEPQRTIPIGIMASLVICTIIYIVVSALLTGITPYSTLNVGSPVSHALLNLGHRTAAGFVAAGAVAGLTTVMLVMYYGLTRIIMAIAQDGLLPKSLYHIHPVTRAPVKIILITGAIISLIAGFVPIHHAAELVNIGTLMAFTFVCGGVVVLRKTQPQLLRPFRLPFSPLFPILGMGFCIYLMSHLPAITWWRFGIWTLIGMIVYFCYGKKHSQLESK